MSKSLPFEISARHTGHETIIFIVVSGSEEIDTYRYGLGDAERRHRLAQRWASNPRLCGSLDVSVEEIEQALLKKEQAVRESIDRGDADAATPTQASALLAAVEGKLDLFHDEFKIGYVTIGGDHQETYPINSKNFRLWLGREFYEAHGRPANSQALKDALHALESRAIHGGPGHEVAVRLTSHEGAIYVDVGDDDWSAVEITTGGWQLVSCPPVKFRRPAGSKSLPIPQHGGHIDDLRPFINVSSDQQFFLIVGWVLGCFMPAGPYAILIINGEQGAAKSTTSRMLRELVDPNCVLLRSPPRSERDLVIAAHNARVVGLDNVSDMPDFLSDALCRISTGGGFSARALFTDNEEALFTGSRPILLNGIGDFATRPDLLDRALHVTLPAIGEDRRTDEATLWARFREAQPWIFGALLDAVACALGNFASTKLEHAPRMADFARWVVAAEPALGWTPGTFLSAHRQNRIDANSFTLDSSPISGVLIQFLEQRDTWTGSATDLLQALDEQASERVRKDKTWPQAASRLGTLLRRLAPNLRAAGINVEFGQEGNGKHKRRAIMLHKTLQSAVPADPLSQQSVSQGPQEAVAGQQLDLAPSPEGDPAVEDFPVGDSMDGWDGNEQD